MIRRGASAIVCKGTKHALEEYFVTKFPLASIWQGGELGLDNFDLWHKKRTLEIARAIDGFVQSGNRPQAVSAKFLNTFMHQLMKYEACRPLLRSLHLPLDSRVFHKLRSLHCQSLAGVKGLLSDRPYVLTYLKYMKVQAALLALMEELNSRPETEFKFYSRIELNWLWI